MVAALTFMPASSRAAPDPDGDDGPAKPVTEIVITARRLDAARENINTSLGASTYALSNGAVESRPGSETVSISQVLLQAPGVSQDGSGQLHVRQSHGDLQYRINNVILPEGLSDLGESLSSRIAAKVELVTGALPAQYGLQVGGVVNITTKSAAYQSGGQLEVYGGSHAQLEPAIEYGGSVGSTNIFVSGSYLRNNLGLASPDGSGSPLHDHTDQIDAFAFIDHTLDPQDRLSLILGVSDDRFQIPNRRGLNAQSYSLPGDAFRRPLTANGVSRFSSEQVNDSKREQTQFAVASFLHATEKASVQVSAFARYSALTLQSDEVGDLLFVGVSQDARDTDAAFGVQIEGVYELATDHTLRAGW